MSLLTLTKSKPALDLKETVGIGRMRGIWRMMTGYRRAYLTAGVSLGVATAARTASLLIIQYFVDSYLGQNDRSIALWAIAAGFIVLALVQGGFTFLSGILAAHTAEGIAERVRNYLLNHIQHLPFAYHDEMQTGELMTRVTSDVDALRRFFSVQAIESSRIVFLFLINFVAIWWLNWQLALISIIVIPVILVISVFFFRKVSKAYEAYQEQESVLTTTLQENLTGVRVVKAFARQPFEQDKFETANINKYRKGKGLLLMHSLYWPISDILCAIQMLAGFAIAAFMAINGTITVGTYLAYSGMLLLIIWPIRNLGRLVVEMSRGLVSFERISEIVRVDRENMDEPDFTPPARLQGDVTFENVSFAYGNQQPAPEISLTLDGAVAGKPSMDGGNGTNGAIGTNGTNGVHQNGAGQKPQAKDTSEAEDDKPKRAPVVALQGISFRARPGQRVALMGAAGAGKTTLVNLLPRFYEYTGGHIWLDGVELKNYSRRYLRQQIGIVEQEPFLFSRTVRDNITYSVGRDVSQAEVEEAARAAAIHDVILNKLPQGYDTLIGERGTTLSGGQKQRVAIARTLLKDPRILILDDSTSAVDTETEAAIREALERLMENRTTFIIAHRIQSVMNADLILVLNGGRVVQSGAHDQLIAQDGMYRRIYAAQTRIEDELQKELNRVRSV
jgi:ABC-type multidrug transport system fused ATPase/permease subunit